MLPSLFLITKHMNLKGVIVAFYPPCEDCDIDSLPFKVMSNGVPDYYDIAFTFTETGDTLFYATIIWMGLGQILYPNEFLPANSFKIMHSDNPEPIGTEYFDFVKMEDSLEMKGQVAWETVRNLDISKEFAKYPYRVGIHLYPPTVGVFDTNPAKWIVFLYRGALE